MQYSVLVIEDDEILNSGLCYNIQKIKMHPSPAYSVEDAKRMVKDSHFDLILLDVNLPDGNGFDFAKEVVAHYNIPFIFLTAHNLEEEIIKGLQTGADDYIVKPFSLRIVMEKIQTVLRRYTGITTPHIYTCGNLYIDFDKHLVKSGNKIVSLTPTEYEILEVFCRNRGRILTKEILLEKIWDDKGKYVNEHTLPLNISRLRNKIAGDGHEYIKTIYGLGYKWAGDE